ncbi:NAD(P)/FAD-dependent oxidoreductase [Novosphingobium olei]|uniref:FAD-dependent oxidoreductase n=1 Tax=Novosphingobium olei TaxID=2728851 RepID=A0A7Y0GB41_9SPHN|nr:FAD-dependent oxidoreductase [Novosphingobium olei]NML94778.1 FAD-dependent oxidoreductase [Novosphingobium olei]
MPEKVLVIGAGIGGLCTALMLAPSGRDIVLLERDGPLETADPDELFRTWKRNGVAHVRQSHAFLARLRTIMKTEHPALLDQLLANGVRELPFELMLTEAQQQAYQPAPGDEELTIVTSRRTTLEMTMRRYVETLPNVELRCGFKVRRLITRKAGDGVIEVRGVAGEWNGDDVRLEADIVVDASGKGGTTIKQLIDEGAPIREENESAGILYFTRHYRLLPGQVEPERSAHPPASGDLGYLKFGIFPGDNGNFSVTVAIPEVETVLRQGIVDPDIFHAATLALPGLQPWTNATRAEPTSKVIGMGDLVSRWRDLVIDDKPVTRGYFALGDTLVRTNPLYGRGCSFAAVSAQALRQVLDATTDPTERSRAFHKAIHAELLPYYLNQRKQDRSAIKRARRALIPGHVPKLKARLATGFVEDGVRIALRSDTRLLREAMRGFHMLEHPDAWLKRPRNLAGVLWYWARGKARNAAAYPPSPGPERVEMMQLLGLDWQADMIIQEGDGRRAA